MQRLMIAAVLFSAVTVHAAAPPVFYKDVLPILQQHCQSCHRAGQIAPMPFETFRQTRPWASAIRQATLKRVMPPWFADPCCGHFENDSSLSPEQIETISSWVRAGTLPGDLKDAPPPVRWEKNWN